MAIKTVGDLIDELRGFDPDLQVAVVHPEYVVFHQTEDCDGYCGVDFGAECTAPVPSKSAVEVHFGFSVDAVETNGTTRVFVGYRGGE